MYLPEYFSSYPAPLIIHGSRPRSNRAINDYCAQVAQKKPPPVKGAIVERLVLYGGITTAKEAVALCATGMRFAKKLGR